MSSQGSRRTLWLPCPRVPSTWPRFFPHHILKKAEEEITQHKSKGHSSSSSQKGYHPNNMPETSKDSKSRKPLDITAIRQRASPASTHSNWPWVSRRINDRYCTRTALEQRDCQCWSLTTDFDFFKREIIKSGQTEQTLNVYSVVVNHAYIVKGQPQKKDSNNNGQHQIIKYVSVLCQSLEFCPTCNKCSSCCSRSTCRGKTAPVQLFWYQSPTIGVDPFWTSAT